MRTFFRSTLAGVAAAAMMAGMANAAPVTTPLGLTPGDTYRLAFITSVTRDATSSDIADYNAFVTGVASGIAELAALSTTWTAIGSTEAVDARDNTGTNPFTDGAGVPIYLLDGSTKIADDNADLWDGSIDNPLNIDESGNTLETLLWTGTTNFGTASGGDGFGGALGSIFLGGTEQGDSSATGIFWIHIDDSPVDQNEAFSLYALSGELTVENSTSISAPGAALAFGLSVFGMMYARRRRRSTPAR